MPHLAGKKVAKSHSTIIEEAEKILKSLSADPLVEKIVTGEIKSLEHAPRRLKITPIDAGLKLIVRGINARQFIFVYTKSPAIVSEQIKAKAAKAGLLTN